MDLFYIGWVRFFCGAIKT